MAEVAPPPTRWPDAPPSPTRFAEVPLPSSPPTARIADVPMPSSPTRFTEVPLPSSPTRFAEIPLPSSPVRVVDVPLPSSPHRLAQIPPPLSPTRFAQVPLPSSPTRFAEAQPPPSPTRLTQVPLPASPTRFAADIPLPTSPPTGRPRAATAVTPRPKGLLHQQPEAPLLPPLPVMASPVAKTASAVLKSRIRNPALLQKLCKPDDLLHHFPNGSYIGWSGFTGVGYPKTMPSFMADHVAKNNLKGKMKYSLFVGASSGADTENRWAELDMIERRTPHQVGKQIAKGINEGRINFFDKHLSMFPLDLTYGFYTKDRPHSNLDVVVVEATDIKEDGSIVPGASVGATPELIHMANKIIVEINTALPSFDGLHDITMPELPPHRTPIAITDVEDRIGTTSIPIDPAKIVGVLESDHMDATKPNTDADETSFRIAGHLIEFFEHEVAQGRLPESLLPLQSGIGNVANAIIGGLAKAKFRNLKVWTEVIQDTFLDLFDSGHLDFATATSIRFSPEGFRRFYDNWDFYHKKVLLRSQQVSNSPEVIRRLGCIAMNTPVEVDIYAHANSTCVMGSRMLNGLGGSGDFLRSSKYSIMHTPSTRPSKTDPHGVSCIVPMCTHVDHTEHDLDIIVTEQGLADVRGLAPRERARVIINKCAHPIYRPILNDYLDKAESECLRKGWGHEPHLLFNSFDMHKALLEQGSMQKVGHW